MFFFRKFSNFKRNKNKNSNKNKKKPAQKKGNRKGWGQLQSKHHGYMQETEYHDLLNNNPLAPVVDDAVDEEEEEELERTETYANYMPSKLKIGTKHPDPVIETSSLASVPPPDITHDLRIPQRVITKGLLSALQLESVTYACQQHEIMLPNKTRAGFLIGDGAGVGKGRTLAGIIYENYNRGNKKSIWLSVSSDLKFDSERDLKDIGATNIKVFSLTKFKYANIDSKVNGYVSEGVVFATYSSLIAKTSVGKNPMTRLQQLIKWCGKDFEGCIVFDECHKAKNLCPAGGSTKPTKTGLAVLELQSQLPKARIVYASATGASEPKNMAYMSRLGLWGEGTPFKEFKDFINVVERRGVGAMELVAMDMKLRGLYIARQLSFEGVTFKIEETPLNSSFIDMYNKSVSLWIEARKSFMRASGMLVGKSKEILMMWRQFWAAHQRFFKYLCIASKVPHAVRVAKEAVEEGKCVVIGLQSTGEARTLEQLEEGGGELNEFVSTAKGVFQSLVEKQFPSLTPKTPKEKVQKVVKKNATGAKNSKVKKEVVDTTESSKRRVPLRCTRQVKRPKTYKFSDNSDSENESKQSSDSEFKLSDDEFVDNKAKIKKLISKCESDSESESLFLPKVKTEIKKEIDSDLESESLFLPKVKTEIKKEIDSDLESESRFLPKVKTEIKRESDSDSEFLDAIWLAERKYIKKSSSDLDSDIENSPVKLESVPAIKTEIKQEMDDFMNSYLQESPYFVNRLEAMKQDLLDKIEKLGELLPPNTLDQLIDELGGPDKVAEMTGRKGRVINSDGSIQYELRSEVDVPLEALNMIEKQRFMDGEKVIAIISEAASSGISLQADRRVKNVARRVHITLELPWSADRAIQQFGRTHRSNQVNAPEYLFLISDLAGERRFASIVAKRLESLGALTHGDRRASESRDLSQFNFDTKYGRMALDITLNSVIKREAPIVPLPSDDFLFKIREELINVGMIRDINLTLEKDHKNIGRFMNRILGLPVGLQNLLFKYFTDTLSAIVLREKKAGRYDLGILDLGTGADVIKRVKCDSFDQKHVTGTAKTELHTVSVERGISWETALEKCEEHSGDADSGFYISLVARNNRKYSILALADKNFSDTSKSKLFCVYRPNTGLLTKKETLSDLKQKYRKATEEEIESHWKDNYLMSETLCSHMYWHGSCKRRLLGVTCDIGLRRKEYHVLSGSVLSVWTKVEKSLSKRFGSYQNKLQVVQLKVEGDENKIIGCLIPRSVVEDLKEILSSSDEVDLPDSEPYESSFCNWYDEF